MPLGKSPRPLRLSPLGERIVPDAVPLVPVPVVGPVAATDGAADPGPAAGHGAGCTCGNCVRVQTADGEEAWALPPIFGSSGVSPRDPNPPYATSQTFLLHSRPAATRKVYLDFTGHTTSGTNWNSSYHGGQAFTSQPFHVTGSGSTYTVTDHDRIQRIWQRVVEDFSPFDVDVTTEDPGLAGLTYSGSGDTTWGIRCIVTPTDNWISAGGVAYLGSFKRSVDTTCYVFSDKLGPNDEKYIAEAASHEVGHTLGLSHDGTSSQGYYGGHSGSGGPGWAPIMGVGYSRQVVQWSQGEYAGANNTQDDLAIITNPTNNFGYRPDDAGNTNEQATAATVAGSAVSAAGVIERTTDVDVWSFDADPGTVSFRVSPWVLSPNLDIRAELRDAGGIVLASANPLTSLSATISFTLPASATYYLAVEGVGVGTASNGYTDYASLGQYTISGTIAPVSRLAGLEAGNLSYTENQSPLTLTSTLTVRPGANLNQATVAVSNYAPGQDRLQFTNPGGITGGFDAGAGVLTLSGPATPAAYQAALRSVTYSNASDTPATSLRTFTFRVRDVGNSLSPAVARSMTVTAVNDAPAAEPDAYSTFEDTPLNVSAGSGVLSGDSDPDSGTLTAVLVDTVEHGTLALAANGSFVYTPAANYNGTDSFTYRARDGSLNSNLATVTLAVAAINDAPIVDNDAYSVGEEGSLSVPVLAGVLNGDADPEGSSLTAALVTTVQHGTLSFDSDGSFTYTPTPNYSGPDAFTYRANDGALNSNVATVALTVIGINDAPVADDDAYTTAEDTPLSVPAATGVLAGDTDVENAPLTVTLVDDVRHGTLSMGPDGSFVYTPAANYNGRDSFTYRASDGGLESNLATVAFTATAVDDPPLVTGEALGTPEDTPLVVAAPGLLANDSDVEGSPLTLVPGTGPAHGVLTLEADGSFTYTPVANYHGSDSFTYTVSDGSTASTPVTVALTVAPVNDTPTAGDDAASVILKKSVTVRVLLNDADVDGDLMSILSYTQPAKGALTRSGSNFIYTATGPLAGTDSFTYTITDPDGATATAVVNLTLTDPVAPALTAVRARYGTAGRGVVNLPGLGRAVLPWAGLSRFEFAFSENVIPAEAALTLTGPGGAVPLTPGTGPAGGGKTATWDVTAPAPGYYTLRLRGAAVVDINGNGVPGNYVRTFGILPGDFDGNGLVDGRDLKRIKRKYQANPAKADRFADVNGDGVVNVLDYNLARAALGSRLI